MLRYAITNGNAAGLVETTIAHARRWAAESIDYVQLREKQLGAGELVQLAAAMMEIFREYGGRTKLLVNGRPDAAVAAGVDGVHLTARPGELTAEQVRRVFRASRQGEPVVSISCHTLGEVRRATAAHAHVDLILFGPVFEKRIANEVAVTGVGLEALREGCEAAGKIPLLALGGVTSANVAECLRAGASGVAGIRIFA